MKITKILYVLLLCLFACEPMDGVADGASSSATHICRGNGYEVAYTIRGNQVCEGNGYTVAYTIR